MTHYIIIKEIVEKLLSLRFTLALLLTISLFVTSGFVYVARYKEQSQDYWKHTNENLSRFSESAKELYKLAFYEQKIWRKPKPLTLCAEGYERYLPNQITSSVFETRLPETSNRGNFLLRCFYNVDWVFIIAVPLSFVALLFTYDSFSGEKEAGTLRLILSGQIPRHRILIGKYLGALFAFAMPVFVGLFINLAIVVSSGIVEVGVADWLGFFAISLLSIVYLSIFLLLGMFISSRVSHSASSIVILLLLWVGLAVLVPSLARIIGETSVNVPSLAELRNRIIETMEQTDREAQAGKYGKNAYEFHEDRDHPLNNPPAAARYWNARSASLNRVWEQQHNQMLAQAHAGRNFACISPIVIYQRASEAIAGTGINRCADIYQQVKKYQGDLKDYLLDEDAEDPNSLHMLFAFEFAVEKWGTISKKPVDFNAVPKFQERDLALGESLKLAIWDIGLLALFNLVFFAASFVSFMKYDVR